MPLYTLKETCILSCEYDKEIQIEKETESTSLIEACLNEGKKVFDTQVKRMHFSVHCDPDRKRNHYDGGVYFKCVNEPQFKHSTKISRIHFNRPEYVIADHSNRGKMKNSALDADEKEILMDLLNSPVDEEKLQDMHPALKKHMNTGWNYLLYGFNHALGVSDGQMIHNIEKGEKLYPQMVDMNLPMPDYNKLPSKLPKKKK